MGLSIRAYAKVRGVSHVAVLKAIKAGFGAQLCLPAKLSKNTTYFIDES